jgi:uncharacterized paraquat-inducible protein A
MHTRRPPLAAGGRTSWGRESLDEPRSPSPRAHGYGGSSKAALNSSLRSSNASAILSPRTSPSKVGSALWGRDTPLAQKGKLPFGAAVGSTWVCAVCLFTDNPHTANQCTVCDCPNYNKRKVSQSQLFLFYVHV